MAAKKSNKTKFCKPCDKRHPVSAFGKSNRSKDGLRSYCRQADSEASKRSREKARRGPDVEALKASVEKSEKKRKRAKAS